MRIYCLLVLNVAVLSFLFFFNDTATTEIYTLSLHDALPICPTRAAGLGPDAFGPYGFDAADRKSTRLNSSHHGISYAVFCLKKKKAKRNKGPKVRKGQKEGPPGNTTHTN